MEVQIASTLALLTKSISDKNVQVSGLKFLVEKGAEGLHLFMSLCLVVSEQSLCELPIIKTIMASMKTNNTVKQVLKLGCSTLITYSRFCR